MWFLTRPLGSDGKVELHGETVQCYDGETLIGELLVRSESVRRSWC